MSGGKACGLAVGAVALLAVALAVPPALAAGKEPLVLGAVTFERAEYRLGDEEDVFAWEGDGTLGTDEWKLRIETEAELSLEGEGFETLENQFLVQHMTSEFFDVKAGIRYDSPAGPNRLYGVLGLIGLAQQWVELDVDLFLSETGAPSTRVDLDYELLVTNRVILTPSAEIDVSFADDREIGVGSGLTSTELGARLSYDLYYRDIAPYVGVHWERSWGETADLKRDEGEATDSLYAVFGVRLMF